MSRRAAQTRRRGFTLLELGIVLAVAAILAGAIVPDLIEAARNHFAEKASKDVSVMLDTARLYYSQNTAPQPYRWPGENAAQTCQFNPGMYSVNLAFGGYVTLDSTGAPYQPRNPWGRTYDPWLYSYVSPMAPGQQAACLFEIDTDIPSTLTDQFTSYLPNASCNKNGLANCHTGATATPAGFTRCCAMVPKPAAGVGDTIPGCPSGYNATFVAGVGFKCCANGSITC